MTLKEWVAEVGGFQAVADLIDVDEKTVGGWTRQISTPKAAVMRRIVKASRGRVTFDQIIAETMGVKPLGFGG